MILGGVGAFEPDFARGFLGSAVGGEVLEDFENEFGLLGRTDLDG